MPDVAKAAVDMCEDGVVRIVCYIVKPKDKRMKKLFALFGALLLWQSVAVAQNVLHIWTGDSTRVVRMAELDSVTVRDTKFYGAAWEYVAMGTYQFTQVFGNISTSPVYRRQVSEDLWQYKFENWLYQGYDLIIDYNVSTGRCRVQPQPTGYVHGDYGMIMVTDGATYTGNEEGYPSYFVKNNNTFELYMVYYVEQGVFGHGYEYMVLEGQSSAPARERKVQSIDLKLADKQLLPLAPVRKAVPMHNADKENTSAPHQQLKTMTTREITE